jgi:hypothetical protein
MTAGTVIGINDSWKKGCRAPCRLVRANPQCFLWQGSSSERTLELCFEHCMECITRQESGWLEVEKNPWRHSFLVDTIMLTLVSEIHMTALIHKKLQTIGTADEHQ